MRCATRSGDAARRRCSRWPSCRSCGCSCTATRLRAPRPVLAAGEDVRRRDEDGATSARAGSRSSSCSSRRWWSRWSRGCTTCRCSTRTSPTQTAGCCTRATSSSRRRAGLIVDSTGQVLVDNTSVQVMTIDQDRLEALPDHGAAVLTKVAALLHMSEATPRRRDHPVFAEGSGAVLDRRAVPAGAGRDAPVDAGVARGQRASRGLPRRRDPDGDLPSYPNGALAGHVLGYTAQITAADKKQQPEAHRRRHDRGVRARGAVRQGAARRRRHRRRRT